MYIEYPAFTEDHHLGEDATHPLARSDGRLTLSLLFAGISLLHRRFAPTTRLPAPLCASNYGL
jgi:hypothetical protein